MTDAQIETRAESRAIERAAVRRRRLAALAARQANRIEEERLREEARLRRRETALRVQRGEREED